jgi:chromate transport protein ChrA
MIGISEAEFEMVLFVILPFITAGCIIIYLVISLYEDYKRNNKFKHYEDYYK